MLAAWPEKDQGLPEITARPSNRAGRYFVLRSSSCSLSEICGRTSNKITRWPSKFTTPRSTPGTHTPRQWTQLATEESDASLADVFRRGRWGPSSDCEEARRNYRRTHRASAH